MDFESLLNNAFNADIKRKPAITFDDLLEQAGKVQVKTSTYGRHYNKVIKLPKTDTELRMYIHNNNKQLVATTISTAPIKHGYKENQFVKHYRRAGRTTIQPHELRYLAKLSGGDFSKYKQLVRERVGFAMSNSEIDEITHRAVKNKPSECMCAIIERANDQVKIYTK